MDNTTSGLLVSCIVFSILTSAFSGSVYGLPDSVAVNVTASSYKNTTGYNPPEAAYDNDFSTLWSSYGAGQWIQFAFSEEIVLDVISISFLGGNQRTYYLSIEVSDDGQSWTEVYDGQSSGTTLGLESFFFQQVDASYVRIIGKGSSSNSFNNYYEVYFPPLHSSLCSEVEHNRSLDILFLGNSYTSYGPVPNIVQYLATTASWPTPDVYYNAIGGGRLSDHRVNAISLALVDRGGWDYVVLQDYSWRAFEDPDVMNEDMAWFYDRIKSSSQNATIVLYETWATLSPASTQEAMYSTWSQSYIDTYNTTQNTISSAYEYAAYDYIPANAGYSPSDDTLLAPVGDAWVANMESGNDIRLHLVSDNHANNYGRYLNALVLYSTIYQSEPSGVGDWVIDAGNASMLRDAAESVTGYSCGVPYSSGLAVELDAPQDGYITPDTSVDFTFKASDDDAVDSVVMYGDFSGEWAAEYFNDTYVNDTWLNVTIDGIPDGTYTWGAYANDSSGNEAWSIIRTLTIDTTAPYFTSIEDQSAPENIPFSYTPEAADYGAGLDGWAINDSSLFSIDPGTGEITNSSAMVPGQYAYTIYVNDSLGNTGESAWMVTVTPVDRTAPYFTAIPDDDSITYPSDWTGADFDAADETALGQYSVNDSRFAISQDGYLDTGVMAAGTYGLDVSVIDTSGNIASAYYELSVAMNAGSCSVIFTEASPVVYPATFVVWSDCNSALSLYRNGSLVSNGSVQSLGPGTWNFTVVRHDTENYSYVYDEESFDVTPAPDTTPPQYSNNAANNTMVGMSTGFSLTVDDDTALESSGYYIFSTNNTGTWENDSAVNFISTPQNIETVKVLNDALGLTVEYMWYLYDNEGNGIATPAFSLSTTPVVESDPSECQTLSTPGEVYTLHNDVSSAGTCFSVSAANVTIDCHGYTITYSTGGASNTYGINTGQLSTLIKNCNIVDGNFSSPSGNRYGIYLNGADNGIIRNVTVNVSNSYGIRLFSNANNNLIEDASSISASSSGIYLYSSTNNTIINSKADSGTSYGFYLLSSQGNTISGSAGNSGSTVGIYIAGSDGGYNNISNSEGFSSLGTGIQIGSSHNTIYASNGTSLGGGYGDYGIQLGGTEGNRVVNFTGTSSGNGHGIYIAGSSHSEIENVTGVAENGNGIYLYGSGNVNITRSASYSANSVAFKVYNGDNCIVSNSTFSSDRASAVYLYGGSDNNTFTGNVFVGTTPVVSVSSDSVNNVFL